MFSPLSCNLKVLFIPNLYCKKELNIKSGSDSEYTKSMIMGLIHALESGRYQLQHLTSQHNDVESIKWIWIADRGDLPVSGSSGFQAYPSSLGLCGYTDSGQFYCRHCPVCGITLLWLG